MDIIFKKAYLIDSCHADFLQLCTRDGWSDWRVFDLRKMYGAESVLTTFCDKQAVADIFSSWPNEMDEYTVMGLIGIASYLEIDLTEWDVRAWFPYAEQTSEEVCRELNDRSGHYESLIRESMELVKLGLVKAVVECEVDCDFNNIDLISLFSSGLTERGGG